MDCMLKPCLRSEYVGREMTRDIEGQIRDPILDLRLWTLAGQVYGSMLLKGSHLFPKHPRMTPLFYQRTFNEKHPVLSDNQ